MAIVPIRKAAAPRKAKHVEATQKAIDALPLASGMWKLKGVPGLYVRCRATSKSYLLQRRVEGRLVKETLGPLSVKAAKEKAMAAWGVLRPAPASEDVTLGTAIEAYIEHRVAMNKMAPATEKLARYNAARYLESWKKRTLANIGEDRARIAALHGLLTREHGAASCNQVMRLLSAVYRWHRDTIHTDLPDWPRKVAAIHSIKARDWAYTDDELRAWWRHTVKPKGSDKPVDKGVSTLGTIKRMWWLTALLTGGRKGSIEALEWRDVDLDKKVLRFRVAKGDRPYSVPISDTLAELLTKYRESGDVPPSQWVFPSSVIDGGHLRNVKNPVEGVGPAHQLRHTYRTMLAQLGAAPDQARLLMGHSMGGDVSRGYVTAPLVVESLRPISNAVAKRYVEIIGIS